ncbi:MAG: thioredoxin domain-containing protein [Deltaproteobacteria bacterium]|nr:MAG: thioredoxin domain-containing protein [Deltaproteobacteria bacterium]
MGEDGSDYVPPRKNQTEVFLPNHLAGETSPYLLQHADNPVDWYPWGDEALNRARNEDKPILLSIGYSACHWCHVMAHECFENENIARLMNDNFINIKVDREERPDLDTVYLEAVQAMTGRGGWPLTVFLTPEGKPFFGGTYFPPEDRHGIPGFPRVLKTVVDAYHNRRRDIERTVGQLLAVMSRTIGTGTSEPLTEDTLDRAYSVLKQDFDRENGGFGNAPKFPQPMTLEFLLRYFHRTQDSAALEMVELTLEKMARGGIYDQIGGGFHRYATDANWLIPHFEKMLYDNALLSRVYLSAYLVTGKQLYRTIAEETLNYVLREMTDPQGGFYSTQDADSEGVEGKYYLWTAQEIAELAGKDFKTVYDYFGVTPEGNFEGRNILHVTNDAEPDASSITGQVKAELLKSREQRVRPGRDEKVLTSWNGLMLSSLAEAACVLDRNDYLAAAVASGTFLINSMIADGHLEHTYMDGKSGIDGYLQDYTFVIDGLLTLHQATFGGEWLRYAVRLTEIMIEQFWDETTGTLYDSSEKHQDLFVRPKNMFDGAIPSGSSAATLILLKLARITDNEHLKRISEQLLKTMRESMSRHPLGFSNWLCALDFYLSAPKEIAIIGQRDHPSTSDLLHTLYSTWLPNKVIAACDPGDPNPVSGLKLLENKQMVGDRPTVYVCKRYTCQAPVTDPASLDAQLRGKNL